MWIKIFLSHPQQTSKEGGHLDSPDCVCGTVHLLFSVIATEVMVEKEP